MNSKTTWAVAIFILLVWASMSYLQAFVQPTNDWFIQEFKHNWLPALKEQRQDINKLREEIEKLKKFHEEKPEKESSHLIFSLPESNWENSAVIHPDGTYRVWETHDGKIWGYGDIIKPR